MSDNHSPRDVLHEATHRVPGVPAHVDHPAGHQGKALQARTVRQPVARDRSSKSASRGSLNHSAARPPRVLVAWQRRIAAFFGQEV